MSPVVISYVSVVLLDAQQPAAKHLIVNVKALNQIQVEEHSETCFEGAIIVQI